MIWLRILRMALAAPVWFAACLLMRLGMMIGGRDAREIFQRVTGRTSP